MPRPSEARVYHCRDLAEADRREQFDLHLFGELPTPLNLSILLG